MKDLAALLNLRWTMVRSRRRRVGLLVLLVSLPLQCIGALVAAQHLDSSSAEGLRLLAPSTFLGFAALSVVAPLAAGGGNQLFPTEQLVAFPMSRRTVFLASLAVIPLNLVWATQLIVLFASTGLVAHSLAGSVLGALTTTTYVAFVSTAGQVAAWLVVGVRQRRSGRVLTWCLLLGIVITAALVTRARAWTSLLDRAPTVKLLAAISQADQGVYGRWAERSGLLVALTAMLTLAGVRATGWALRQDAHSLGRLEAKLVRRRDTRGTPLRQVQAVDRASVWRASSLRRGLLVLAAIPGAVAFLGTASYQQLVLVPGLVASGAGLLFGVNAFCLDGTGALWLASLPRGLERSGASKLRVTLECCGVAISLALVGGLLRQPQRPTAAELTALVGASLASTLLVVAACARWSVLRPHHADLRGPRDTPAPPGTMAVYSLRLALTSTLAGLVLSAAAQASSWRVPAAVALGLAVLALSSLRRTGLEWRSERRRSLVAAAVANG